MGRSFQSISPVYDFVESNSLPVVIEATPACNAVEVAGSSSNKRKSVKLFPRELDRIFYQARDAQVPMGRIELRNRSFVQNRPFERERLSGWQAVFIPHLLLFLFALIAGEESGKYHGLF